MTQSECQGCEGSVHTFGVQGRLTHSDETGSMKGLCTPAGVQGKLTHIK